MTQPSDEFRAADIALHTGWMRRLARGLLGDPAAADDVVQDAWAKLGTGARSGYLAAVVRSFARRRQRAERRRALRERAAAHAEALPSTADVAARSELARLLAEAVERLAEPYRTTLVLRYYHGLPAAEIARRAGIPTATVRARLKRGLDALRARLDEQDGGRARWVSALLPLARPRAALLGASVTALLALKLALASVLALSGLALLWRTASIDDSGPRRPAEAASAPEAPPASGADAWRLEAPEAIRRAVPADASPAGSSAQVAGTLRGRVHAWAMDERGFPVPDAWLRLGEAPESRTDGDGSGELLLDVKAAEIQRLAGLDGSRLLTVEIGARGCRTRTLRPILPEGRTAIELGEVRLPPGTVVHGRVFGEGGRAVAGALVAFGTPLERLPNDPDPARRGPIDLDAEHSSWRDLEPAITTVSRPDGSFRLAGLPPGHGTVWARTDTSLWAFSEPIGLLAGEEIGGLELVVREAPQETLSGRVVDPDGRPVPGLELTFSATDQDDGWWNAVTDARGAFHFAPLDGAPQDISARAPAWEWEDLERGGVAPGMHGFVLAFERSQWVEVEVRDPAGVSVRNGRVVGLPADGPTARPLQRCESPLDAAGRARLRRPLSALRVRVEAPGFRDRILGPFEPALFPRPLAVTLEPVPALLGQVSRSDGEPAAGATVSLHRAAGAGAGTRPPGAGLITGSGFLTHQGWGGDRDPFVTAVFVEPEARVTADEAGCFRLPLPGVDARSPDEVEEEDEEGDSRAGLAALGYGGPSRSAARTKGPWYVHASLAGAATVTSGPHAFDPERDATLVLRLPPGGSIAGRLVLEDRQSGAGWTAWASDGLAQVAEAPVRADGTFELHDLHAGGWQIRLFEPGRRFFPGGGRVRTEREPVPDVEVLTGQTVAYEHYTAVRERALLHGHLSVDGAPPGPWRVTVRASTSRGAITSHDATLDPDGDFEIALEPGLRTTLRIQRAQDGALLSVSAEPTILPGTNPWSFAFTTARLEGTFTPDDTAEPFGSRLSYEVVHGAVTIGVSWTAREDGRFGPLLVPAGHGVLRGPRRDWRERAPIWAELDLEPGETRRVALPPR
jgi:RNA polymerase sigma factor (sigma-70 family)